MNTLKEVKRLTKFKDQGTVTKMVNLAERYDLRLSVVKNCYIEAIDEVLNTRELIDNNVEKSLKAFIPEDWRQVWNLLIEKVQHEVKKEGGSRQGSITRLETKVRAIIKSDKIKIQREIKLLELEMAEAKSSIKRTALKNKINKLKDFLEYVDDEAVFSHFCNKVKINPKLSSFAFAKKK